MPRQLRPLLMVLALVGCVEIAVAQAPGRFALDRFENKSCRGKGRLQECDSSTMMRQILAAGSQSVPVLISQLGETRRTKEPIEDFWNYTTSGDIAFILLTDLFTDRDGKSFTMPEVPNWERVMSGCSENAEACWRNYVRINGIKSVQQAWQNAWETSRDRIAWDADARCFRLKK